MLMFYEHNNISTFKSTIRLRAAKASAFHWKRDAFAAGSRRVCGGKPFACL